jgi:hypothetical protein
MVEQSRELELPDADLAGGEARNTRQRPHPIAAAV